MPSYRSDFVKTVFERGFVQDCSDIDALDALAKSTTLTAYIGFDCTAPSLHAGSLLPIMLLRWLQKTGHQPIVLMGGGTTKVGDPSGKDKSRLLLSLENINENMLGIKKIFLIPNIFSLIFSEVSSCRLLSLPDGSPTLVVPPPIRTMG